MKKYEKDTEEYVISDGLEICQPPPPHPLIKATGRFAVSVALLTGVPYTAINYGEDMTGKISSFVEIIKPNDSISPPFTD
ncbi:hypothetical protein BH23PAT2_BH23PAT2_07860 [soil metagenome]